MTNLKGLKVRFLAKQGANLRWREKLNDLEPRDYLKYFTIFTDTLYIQHMLKKLGNAFILPTSGNYNTSFSSNFNLKYAITGF